MNALVLESNYAIKYAVLQVTISGPLDGNTRALNFLASSHFFYRLSIHYIYVRHKKITTNVPEHSKINILESATIIKYNI